MKKMKGKIIYLLIAMVIMIAIQPFIPYLGNVGAVFIVILISLLGLAGVYIMSHDKQSLIFALFLALPFVVVKGVNYVVTTIEFVALNALFSVLFYGYLIIVIFKYVLSAKKITTDILAAAISVYLLFGVLWIGLYSLVSFINPEAFSPAVEWADLLYFSFVTLTTLGYGDIVPVSEFARTLSIMEAITGVLFIAVLIARLMSVYGRQHLVELEREEKRDIKEIMEKK
jgi:voltage-gated potassium channel Kch